MSDTGDDYKAWKNIKRDRRDSLEPDRTNKTIERLDHLGFKTQYDEVHRCVIIETGVTKRMRFYPYTGWYQGSGFQGRGFENLLKTIIKESHDKS